MKVPPKSVLLAGYAPFVGFFGLVICLLALFQARVFISSCEVSSPPQEYVWQIWQHTRPNTCAAGPIFAWIANNTLVISCDFQPTYSFSLDPAVFGSGLSVAELPYKSPVDLEGREYVRARCHYPETDYSFGTQDNFLARNAASAAFKARSRNVSRSLGTRRWNVMALLFKSLSQEHFERSFPLTLELLSRNEFGSDEASLTSAYSSFRFRFYASVAQQAASNHLALLADRRNEHELLQQQQQTGGWLFRRAKLNGYVTLFAENDCDLPTSVRQYFRPADKDILDHRLTEPFCQTGVLRRLGKGMNDSFLNTKRRSTGDAFDRDGARCLGHRTQHAVLLSYLQSFAENYADVPRFSVAIFAEGLEESMVQVKAVDADLKDFLGGLQESHHLENTIVVLLSDQGHQASAYARDTFAGRQEARHPFLRVLVPKGLLVAVPALTAHLTANQDKLLTPHDIYRTIARVLDDEVQEPESDDGVTLWDRLPARSCSTLGNAYFFVWRAYRYHADVASSLCLCESRLVLVSALAAAPVLIVVWCVWTWLAAIRRRRSATVAAPAELPV